MLSEQELTAIDDWRFENRVATRSDAIRRLCQLALAVDKSIVEAFEETLKNADVLINAYKSLGFTPEEFSRSDFAPTLEQSVFLQLVDRVFLLQEAIKEVWDYRVLATQARDPVEQREAYEGTRAIFDRMVRGIDRDLTPYFGAKDITDTPEEER